MLLQKNSTVVNKIKTVLFFMKAFTHMVIHMYVTGLVKYVLTCLNNPF
jgi:hypothetical protein